MGASDGQAGVLCTKALGRRLCHPRRGAQQEEPAAAPRRQGSDPGYKIGAGDPLPQRATSVQEAGGPDDADPIRQGQIGTVEDLPKLGVRLGGDDELGVDRHDLVGPVLLDERLYPSQGLLVGHVVHPHAQDGDRVGVAHAVSNIVNT